MAICGEPYWLQLLYLALFSGVWFFIGRAPWRKRRSS